MSSGRQKSVRKGLGWAWATTLWSCRSCWYSVDRLAKIPLKITLREDRDGHMSTMEKTSDAFEAWTGDGHSPEATEHAGYHQVHDHKLTFHVLLRQSDASV